MPSKTQSRLPHKLKKFFWECRFEDLDIKNDTDFIIFRLLARGDWDSLIWLRKQVGDKSIKQSIIRRKGRGLDAPRLRFWELILDIPKSKVDSWLKNPARLVWEDRYCR
jgi:hypothetical protein